MEYGNMENIIKLKKYQSVNYIQCFDAYSTYYWFVSCAHQTLYLFEFNYNIGRRE